MTRHVLPPSLKDILDLWGFKVGDRVMERIGPHAEAILVRTVIAEQQGRSVRTQTGRWYDALTGATERKCGEDGYFAIHSADIVLPLVGTGAHA